MLTPRRRPGLPGLRGDVRLRPRADVPPLRPQHRPAPKRHPGRLRRFCTRRSSTSATSSARTAWSDLSAAGSCSPARRGSTASRSACGQSRRCRWPSSRSARSPGAPPGHATLSTTRRTPRWPTDSFRLGAMVDRLAEWPVAHADRAAVHRRRLAGHLGRPAPDPRAPRAAPAPAARAPPSSAWASRSSAGSPTRWSAPAGCTSTRAPWTGSPTCTASPASTAVPGTRRRSRSWPSGCPVVPSTARPSRSVVALGRRSLSGYLTQSVVWTLLLMPWTLHLGAHGSTTLGRAGSRRR